MMSLSSQISNIEQTGTAVSAKACMTRNSRSTAWAEGSSCPGGFFRRTKRLWFDSSKKVGLDWPPSNWRITQGRSKPSKWTAK